LLPETPEKPEIPEIPETPDIPDSLARCWATVQAIDHLASERWREGIGALWFKLVHSRQMASYLTMRYGSQAGHMNRYAVTALVYRLLLAGVYRRDVPMLSLHLLLEGTSRKNKFYTSMGKYPLGREQEAFLRTLLRG